MTKVFSIAGLIVIIILLGIYYAAICKDEYNPAEHEQEIDNGPVVNKQFVYNLLRSDIDELLADDRDNYSIFIFKPGIAAEPLVINDKVRRSASMIKVFIMAYAMDEAAHTKLNLSSTITLKGSDKVGGAGVISGWHTGTAISIEELIRLMITESDNTATNMLIDYLGMDNINSYIKRNGYSDTILQRKMMDLAAVSAGRENYSSVKDLGDFFNRLVKHSCVSHKYDQKMVDILLQQTDTEVFPAALPGVEIAHKTGELNNLYDDGGIVFADKGPFVIVIMDDDVTRMSAVSKMKKLLQAVNKRLNGD